MRGKTRKADKPQINANARKWEGQIQVPSCLNGCYSRLFAFICGSSSGFLSLWLFLCASVSLAQRVVPLSIEESVMLAWKQSPQARAARFAREAAQVQADRDKPVARPTVNASASVGAQGPRVTFPRS